MAKFGNLVFMHGKDVEFGNLIPGKLLFAFGGKSFAILRANLSFI